MSTSTHKKVLLRHRAAPAPAAVATGFLEPGPLAAQPEFHLLSPHGQAIVIPRESVLAVYFVHAFPSAPLLATAPPSARGAARFPGLWVRVRLRDHFSLEGILTTDLLQLDAGLTLSPLYSGCPWQRIYVPRQAIDRLEPVMLVRPTRARRGGRAAQPASTQFPLFDPLPQAAPPPLHEDHQ